MNFNNNYQQQQSDFPSLGQQADNNQRYQNQQMQQQQMQFQQQFQGGFQNQNQMMYNNMGMQYGQPMQNQFVQQQFQFPGQNQQAFVPPTNTFSQPTNDSTTASASATDAAAGDNADSNPFAANPFGSSDAPTFTVKEFKPVDKAAIDLGDDSGFPGFGEQAVSKNKKKKDTSKLAEERKKKKEEEDAKKPTKGMPSTFFILDHDPTNNSDPYGNNRVPTSEQRIFIFTHYPTFAQEREMIMKLYELYQCSVQDEQDQENYKKQSKNKKNQDDTEEVLISDLQTKSGAGFGAQGAAAASTGTLTKRQARANQKKQQQALDAKVKGATKEKDKALVQAKQQEKIAIKIKDVDPATLGEDAIDIDLNKQPASLVFIGHVDAGKSTICGQIVYQMGLVDERTIQQFKEEAKKKGRDSWWLAYIMDNNEEEMEKGKTVDIGRTCFDTNNKAFTILDAPGHKNYVPNMIQGVAQADYAGLVISARKGEFEAGFEKEGQTREHIQLVKSLGVQKLVIIVNKMDEPSVKWNKKRYDEIQENLLPFLINTGFREEDLSWIPISGLNGDNITEKTDSCDWYDGPGLIDIFDQLPIEERDAHAPLRFPVLDKMKETNKIIVFGKVEQGTLRLGDKLALSPLNHPCQVLGIENFKDENVKLARPGDAVKVKLSYLQEDQVQKGDVLCPRDNQMFSSQVLLAELDLLELRIPVLTKGSTYMMHIHTFSDLITIQVIEWAIEKDNQGVETRKEKPPMTKSFAKCLVRIQSRNPIPVEKCNDLAALGRFTLRDEGKTIALGRITKFVPFNRDNVKKVAVPGQFAKSAAGDGTTVDKSKNEVFDAETGKVTTKKPDLGAIDEDDEQ